jgi:predicted transcriptional regulator
MKRTTIYLEPELQVLLERETRKRGQPMAALIREAVRDFLTREPSMGPPGAGAFASGRTDTADDVDRALIDSGFGR